MKIKAVKRRLEAINKVVKQELEEADFSNAPRAMALRADRIEIERRRFSPPKKYVYESIYYTEINDRLIKNKDTPEGKEFWEYIERTAAEVATWPAWKRGEV